MSKDSVLSIEVKSPVEHANDLIGRIIMKALHDGGFRNVENYTQQGDPVKSRRLVTVLDAVRIASPDTFHERVSIATSKPADTEFTIEEVIMTVETDVEEVSVED